MVSLSSGIKEMEKEPVVFKCMHLMLKKLMITDQLLQLTNLTIINLKSPLKLLHNLLKLSLNTAKNIKLMFLKLVLTGLKLIMLAN